MGKQRGLEAREGAAGGRTLVWQRRAGMNKGKCVCEGQGLRGLASATGGQGNLLTFSSRLASVHPEVSLSLSLLPPHSRESSRVTASHLQAQLDA